MCHDHVVCSSTCNTFTFRGIARRGSAHLIFAGESTHSQVFGVVVQLTRRRHSQIQCISDLVSDLSVANVHLPCIPGLFTVDSDCVVPYPIQDTECINDPPDAEKSERAKPNEEKYFMISCLWKARAV